jgi:hypothetical protein
MAIFNFASTQPSFQPPRLAAAAELVITSLIASPGLYRVAWAVVSSAFDGRGLLGV